MGVELRNAVCGELFDSCHHLLECCVCTNSTHMWCNSLMHCTYIYVYQSHALCCTHQLTQMHTHTHTHTHTRTHTRTRTLKVCFVFAHKDSYTALAYRRTKCSEVLMKCMCNSRPYGVICEQVTVLKHTYISYPSDVMLEHSIECLKDKKFCRFLSCWIPQKPVTSSVFCRGFT